jgi:hypothetical protein
MTDRPATHGPRPPVGERTDITNRAITWYTFFDARLRAGHDLIIREPETGKALLVRLL